MIDKIERMMSMEKEYAERVPIVFELKSGGKNDTFYVATTDEFEARIVFRSGFFTAEVYDRKGKLLRMSHRFAVMDEAEKWVKKFIWDRIIQVKKAEQVTQGTIVWKTNNYEHKDCIAFATTDEFEAHIIDLGSAGYYAKIQDKRGKVRAQSKICAQGIEAQKWAEGFLMHKDPEADNKDLLSTFHELENHVANHNSVAGLTLGRKFTPTGGKHIARIVGLDMDAVSIMLEFEAAGKPGLSDEDIAVLWDYGFKVKMPRDHPYVYIASDRKKIEEVVGKIADTAIYTEQDKPDMLKVKRDRERRRIAFAEIDPIERRKDTDTPPMRG